VPFCSGGSPSRRQIIHLFLIILLQNRNMSSTEPTLHSSPNNDDATPSTPRLNASELSTPISGQHNKAINHLVSTPPLLYGGATSSPLLNDDIRFTPSIFNDDRHDNALEPPAWVPPDAYEVECTDAAWNDSYNNNHQHHFLEGVSFPKDDVSIGSNLTNNSSRVNKIHVNPTQIRLRPRGLSLSITDGAAVGSKGLCHENTTTEGYTQQKQHHRGSSLPMSFFTSSGSESGQHIFNPSARDNQSSHQFLHVPYALYTHYNPSQVKADGVMGGLNGTMLDLYEVDRSVDCAAAKSMATKSCSSEGRGGVLRAGQNGETRHSPQKTSLGTLTDIQCILQLHKVDQLVDRFKHDLQMPEIFEKDVQDGLVLMDLRKTDVEIEEYISKNKKKMKKQEKKIHLTGIVQSSDMNVPSDDEEELEFQKEELSMGLVDSFMLTERSLATEPDPYHFFDPYEIETMCSNSYHQLQVVSASIHDNLDCVIELLRTDYEVTGACRQRKDMDIIKPLLEVDQYMNKLKGRSETKDLWDADLGELYITDVWVVAAKKKSMKCQSSNNTTRLTTVKLPCTQDSLTAESSKSSNTKVQGPLSPVEEGKVKLSEHLQQADFTQLLPPPPAAPIYSPLPPRAPMSSPQSVPQTFTKRDIFSAQETSKMTESLLLRSQANASPVITTAKRSIFSTQEKSAAAKGGGVMTPGTTTIVLAKGGDMIDDIPVGKVV